MFRLPIPLGIVLWFLPTAIATPQTPLLETQAPSTKSIEFNRDIRPILADQCFACHGPDAKNRQADLRLDHFESAVESGAIVPHRATQSEMIARVFSGDPEKQMPPPRTHKPLKKEQKELLKLWIDQGAHYQKHWSYELPLKTEIPSGENGIDFLIRKRLNQLGWQYSPEADRRTLIRRLSFDLTGLPPTPEEVSAFENDQSPKAYEDLVDRLLRSPHYGERMAMGWLDVVRFADTIGYHSDTPRNVWPYRDWVIASFNSNKPFDRFTIEQIAGDLLEDANQETLVGSAFNRLLLSTEEGGAQPKDYESRMLTDRVRAIGTAWLGQTTGCCQCHDHKFDPMTTRDFYALGAFFADIQEPIVGAREEGMAIMTEAERMEIDRLRGLVAKAKDRMAEVEPMLDEAQRVWEKEFRKENESLDAMKTALIQRGADPKTMKALAEALIKERSDRTDKDRQMIQAFFRRIDEKHFLEERTSLANAERDLKAFQDSLPKCLISRSTPQKRVVRILPRGNWMDESGEIMKPALPKYLVPMESGDRELTRLDLAKWIVSRENPLTARTVMNRMWKQFFGIGLSRVLEDLGTQGELPPNAPLLDWLACELIDSGWDVKHMVRMIVLSRCYRQTSRASEEDLARDPLNREHARQSSFRIDAELVRDHALAVSGLLVRAIGGPSVKPYQPAGYWENLNFPTRDYIVDQGEKQYRRGLYTWWQRTFLHPSLLAFDAPSREECAADRSRSNIPQQALVLLNDPTYIEASRALAIRALKESFIRDEDRLQWIYRQVLQRDATTDEKEIVLPILNDHRKNYAKDEKGAEAFLKIGFSNRSEGLPSLELASWTHVVRVLMNLHETITRN